MSFPFHTKPFAHQLEEFNLSRHLPGRAMWWEMGVAKSKVAIDTAASLYFEGKVRGMLVVAPDGVQANWIYDELPTHMLPIVQDRMKCLLWESGRARGKGYQERAAEFLAHDDFAVLAMSYDAMMTQRTKEDKRKKWLKWLGGEFARKFLDTRPVLYVLDESTRIKTAKTKLTKRILASSKYAPYRRVLNGTPVSDSPFHAYPQCLFADPNCWSRLGINNYTEFKTFFGVWEKRMRQDTKQVWPELVRYRNLEILQEVVSSLGSRLLLDDVLDLPPKSYSKRYYYLSEAQQKMYDELKTDYQAWFGDGSSVTAELAIVRQTRLQQVCSGYVPADEESGLRPIGDEHPRLDLLMNTLKDVPHQCIVWGKYNVDIDTIAAALRRAGITFVVYDGRCNTSQKHQAKVDFQEGGAKVFLAKPSAAGRGLTLTAAKTVIYYNNDFVLDNRLQSEGRARRPGQDRPVNYVDLVAHNTIDNHILHVLRTKRNVAACVTGDELPVWI